MFYSCTIRCFSWWFISIKLSLFILQDSTETALLVLVRCSFLGCQLLSDLMLIPCICTSHTWLLTNKRFSMIVAIQRYFIFINKSLLVPDLHTLQPTFSLHIPNLSYISNYSAIVSKFKYMQTCIIYFSPCTMACLFQPYKALGR